MNIPPGLAAWIQKEISRQNVQNKLDNTMREADESDKKIKEYLHKIEVAIEDFDKPPNSDKVAQHFEKIAKQTVKSSLSGVRFSTGFINACKEQRDYMEEFAKIGARPVIGIEPRHIWLEKRKAALQEAMKRKLNNNEKIPSEWLKELSDFYE